MSTGLTPEGSVHPYRDKLRVKNTFLHFEDPDCDPEQPPGPQSPKRGKTDPTSHAGLARGLGAAGLPQAAPCMFARAASTADSAGGVPPVEEDEGAVWHLDARRLRGRDTRLSKTLRPMLERGPPESEFVMTLVPASVSKRRGQSSFKAANGAGWIELKCSSEATRSIDVDVTVRVGGEAHSKRHNFAEETVCRFPTQVDFGSLVHRQSDMLTISLRIVPLGLPLIPSPAPSGGAPPGAADDCECCCSDAAWYCEDGQPLLAPPSWL